MLDGIRATAQSWGVKVAFGIIIVVFVFWWRQCFLEVPSLLMVVPLYENSGNNAINFKREGG